MFFLISIIVVFSILIGIQLKASREYILTIPNLFTVYWFILITMGVVLYMNTYKFSYIGFYWVILMCAIFFSTYYGIQISLKKVIKRNNCETKECNSMKDDMFYKLVFYSTLGLIVLRVFGLLYFLMINNISVFDLIIPSKFMETLNTLTLIKYKVIPSAYSPLISITNTLSFVGILVFGYFFQDFQKKHKYILGIESFIVFVFSMFITASKTDVIFTVLIFASSFLTRMSCQKIIFAQFVKMHKKKIALVIGMATILLCLLCAFIVIRSGFTKSPLDGLKQYGFGMIPAFDYYFTNLIPDELSYGKFTFLGIISFFGYHDESLPQGVYHQVELGIGNYSTNIFTAFRSLIDDFGIYGCILVFVILGSLVAIWDFRYKHNKKDFVALSGLSFVFFFALNSFLISAGNYFSICLAYFIFMIYLMLIPVCIVVIKKIKGVLKNEA